MTEQRSGRRVQGPVVAVVVLALAAGAAAALTTRTPASPAVPAQAAGTPGPAGTDGADGADGATPGGVDAATRPAGDATPTDAARWVRTWQGAPQPPVAAGSLLADGVGAATVRMRVHTSTGGQALRLTLSAVHETRPRAVAAVSVALPQDVTGSSAAAQPGTLLPVTFAGGPGATVPAGGTVVSDPLPYDVPAHADVLVSVAYTGPRTPLTGHHTAVSTSWVSRPGDHTGDVGGDAFVTRATSWVTLTAMDVVPAAGADVTGVVALGDSITEGTRSTLDADRRWPDALADMMPSVAVANAGIGGNQVVTSTPDGGDAVVARLGRDALDAPGVAVLVVSAGVNDVARGTTADAVVAGLRDVGARARARGVAVVLCTVTPFEGRRSWTADREAERRAVNAWIRDEAVAQGAADVVVDLDTVVRDPRRPTRLAAGFDSGDHIHLDDTGQAVIAVTVQPAVRALLQRS